MSVAPVDSNFYERLFLNPATTDGELQKRGEEMEDIFRVRADFLQPDLRADYLKEIRQLANGILSRMSEMKRFGSPEGEIRQLARDSFHKLRSVEDYFANQNAVFNMMTAANRTAFQKNEEKIRSASLTLNDFVMPERKQPQPSFAGTSDWVRAQMSDDLLMGMGLIRVAAAACNGVGWVAQQGIDVVSDGVKLACASTPLMQKACDTGLETISETGQAISDLIPENVKNESATFAQQFRQDYNASIQKTAGLYDREFGIPKEVTLQFGEDLPVVASHLALGGVAKGAFKAVRILKKGAAEGSWSNAPARPLPVSESSLRSAMIDLLEEDAGSLTIRNPFFKKTAMELQKKGLENSEKTTVSASAKTLKLKIARSHYDNGIGQEKGLVHHNLIKTPSFERPASFPDHLNQFYAQCEAYSFKRSKLGARGNGTLNGKLLYKPMDKEVFVLIQNRSSSAILSERIGTSELVKSEQLYAHERLNHLLQNAFDLAKEKGFDRVYFAWDPQYHAVASTLEKNSVSVIGKGSFSQGILKEPLTVFQVEVPK